MAMKLTNNEKVYVTLNEQDKKYVEVFINLGKPGSEEKAYSEAIGRLISLYLQSNGDVNNVIHTLQNIRGNTVTWYDGMKIYSVPDAIAKMLGILTGQMKVEPKIKTFTLIREDKNEDKDEDDRLNPNYNTDAENQKNSERMIYECPKCHEHTLVFENGCYICKNCGYTKCD